jgi:hypothetical protein
MTRLRVVCQLDELSRLLVKQVGRLDPFQRGQEVEEKMLRDTLRSLDDFFDRLTHARVSRCRRDKTSV